MNIVEFFKQIRADIAKKQLAHIDAYTLEKPDYFNWVDDIFYPLNVAAFPDSPALIWRYNSEEKIYSFRSIYERSNQLLNFLRNKGIQPGNHIYSLLPLVPENWISFLATIKGGFILMPTATNLNPKDIVYRFETLFPEVMIEC